MTFYFILFHIPQYGLQLYVESQIWSREKFNFLFNKSNEMYNVENPW